MALILDLDTKEELSLGDYAAFINERVDVEDFDCLVDSAWALRALANNRSFLLDYYYGELKALYDHQSNNLITPQSVALVREPRFFVRANVWLPASNDPFQRQNEQKLYAYGLPHDHNFDFLTVGYAGVGYETDLYRYDIKEVTGYVGEPVELEKLGRERLQPGRVMAYRANRDIHIQYEPEKVSVSLNLIPVHDRLFKAPQYVFDPIGGTIAGGVSDQVGSRLFLMDFFRHMHDGNSVDLLETLSLRHPCLRTRGQALNVLEGIDPHQAERYRARVDPAVLRYSRGDLVHAGYARQKDGG